MLEMGTRVEVLDIDVSKDIRILAENDDRTCLTRTSLRMRQDIPTVNHEHSVAQNMVAMNSENLNTDIVCFKLVRRASRSFVRVTTKQAEDTDSYRGRNFYRHRAGKKMYIITGNKGFIKKFAGDAL